ncbi:M24 family metallopeptidase [Agromyces italicus]|uniref:M24 family metallopeptidase n=1 Tax=Agromyces italicus TaxID=279572 RepID=UPI0003B4491E|nr:Xaa-Pro peptidase family protein [Agromyces italicus]
MPTAATTTDRLRRLADAARDAGIDVVLVAPGPDLAYLVGHSVPSHERLTLLAVPVSAPHEAVMILPALERGGWEGSPAEVAGVRFVTWLDGEDPYAVLLSALDAGATAAGAAIGTVAVDDHLPYLHAFRLQQARPELRMRPAGELMSELRMRKQPAEVDELASVGAAIDRVHRRIGEWLRAGRTENEVAADIAAALVEEGHRTADFVIVASGPNGASPHHEAADRVIRAGDPVVVDIGGPNPAGYNSDSTRTYLVAGGEPDPEFARVHELVRTAQRAAVDAVRPGATAESIDRAAREVIEQAGYGEYFITRTGHGIGLEVHEHPYIVAGNTRQLEPGMAFSIEPGIYLPGRFGVRIEDIVVVGDDGARLMNTSPIGLLVV